MNADKFYKIIENEANETSDQQIREFQAWWHLFTHSLDSNVYYTVFVKNYNKSTNTLETAKSKGVEDDILLWALLIRAIQGDNISDVKKDTTKDLNMDPRKILYNLKKAHQAIEAGECLDNCATTSPIKSRTCKIQKGSKGDIVGKLDGSTTDKCTTFGAPYILNWSQGFRYLYTDGLWNQINV